MSKPDQKILDRIRKMLAMAEDAANANEAAVAAAMAAKLMAKHNLDNADVLIEQLEDDGIVKHEQPELARFKAVPGWAMALHVPVARLHDCDARTSRTINCTAMQMIGQREDAQVAAWVLSYLIDEIQWLASKYQKATGASRSEMTDYRMGASQSIRQTIAKAQAEKDTATAVAAQSGRSLIVLKQDLIRAKFGETKYRHVTRRVRMSEHQAQGKIDGRSVRLNRAINGSAQGRIK